MKKILPLLLLLLAFNSGVYATIYYVATTGKDSNTGTITQPWLSWDYAFSKLRAGDLLYIRGGIYHQETVYNLVNNGTAENPIRVFNYPGETPILDGNPIVAMDLRHWYFKGLTIRNVLQSSADEEVNAVSIYQCDQIKLENMTAYNIGGPGFKNTRNGTVYYTNCDAYNCCDSLGISGAAYGGKGDGFQFVGDDTPDGSGVYYLKGCRSWHNSDDGYDFVQENYAEVDSCWAFNNGYLDGDGQGFKYGLVSDPSSLTWSKIITHCIAAFNENGFNENCNNMYQVNMKIYNNTSYQNRSKGFINFHDIIGGPKNNIYRNNISYKNPIPVMFYGPAVQDHNSWNSPPGVTITDADFVSLDNTEMLRPRKGDGSLPDITFLHLATGSDLIDAGINAGLPYYGTAPDIGAFENTITDPNLKPVTSITVTGAGGATTITTDNGTLQLSTAVLPADATNKTVSWSLANGTGLASINASGLVTATANGTVTARATANDGSGVYGTLLITLSNQIVPVTAITVTGAGGAATITTDNGTLQLSAVITPSYATNKTVTWSIVNGTGQASISATGMVTAIVNGTVTARATANDGSGVYGTLLITLSNQLVPVTAITVTGAGGATTITTDNGTLQLSAAILPADATNKTVTWSITSGPDKASISPAGLVTAIDNGTATLRATANDGSGMYGTLIVTISNQIIPVANITVSGAGGATLITSIGGTLQLSAAVLPSNATNKAVTWSITTGSDKATVNSTGLVTALENGTATVRTTANDGSGVFGVLVITISNQIIPVTGITVTGAGGATSITTDNGTLQLNAAITPSNAANQTVTWSVVNGTGLASISATGLVTAMANGTVTAKATANDGTGVFGNLLLTLSNQVVPVTGITVTGSGGVTTITTNNGTLQLNAAITPANATTQTVSWSLTNGTGEASISSSGLVTAISNGTVTARATANDGTGVFGNLLLTLSNQVVPVTGITVTGSGGVTTITTNNGTLQLNAALIPANATTQTVSWSLTNGTGEASISSSGLVTAISNGTVTARATANDGTGVFGNLILTLSNQVVPVTGITVTGSGGVTTITKENGTLQLNAAITPANATTQTVIWSLTNGTGEASISSSGLVTAISNGIVTAMASAVDDSGVNGTLDITIDLVKPMVIIVNNDQMRVYLDESSVSGRLNLYNLQGYLIDSRIVESNVCVFNTSSLSSGLYMVVLSKSGISEVGKVIVSR